MIIGDMLTWQGAYNPKPGTQTSGEGRTYALLHTHTHNDTRLQCYTAGQASPPVNQRHRTLTNTLLTLNTRTNAHAHARAQVD